MELLGPRFTAHVPIPTQQDIESALLRKKKQELLDKYTNWWPSIWKLFSLRQKKFDFLKFISNMSDEP